MSFASSSSLSFFLCSAAANSGSFSATALVFSSKLSRKFCVLKDVTVLEGVIRGGDDGTESVDSDAAIAPVS